MGFLYRVLISIVIIIIIIIIIQKYFGEQMQYLGYKYGWNL